MNNLRNAERFDLVPVGSGKAGRFLASAYVKEGKGDYRWYGVAISKEKP